jgi:hypothetical protein
MNKAYTIKELLVLKAEYLETLDDGDKDEWYNTHRAIVGEVLTAFLGWLNIKENTP